jgi:hypothetical protein
MLAWLPFAQALHLSISLLWPVLWRIPVLQGTWDGCMDHTIPSYVRTAEEGLFRANLDPVLPMISDCPALLLYGWAERTVTHPRRATPSCAVASHFTLLEDGHYAVLQEERAPLLDWLQRSTPSVSTR